jgi:serine/threonine protein kinase
MTQALKVVHARQPVDVGKSGASTTQRWGRLIHADIKPENILVAANGTDIGSAYPSFKLHDFGLAKLVEDGDSPEPDFTGTFLWQPPESPHISTPAADIWSIGTVLHFLAFFESPVPPMRPGWVDALDEERKLDVQKYRKYYRSDTEWHRALGPRIVSPINLGKRSLISKAAGRTRSKYFDGPVYKPKYSDRLNFWMMECLKFDPEERVTVERLMQEMIPEAQAALVDLGGDKALVDLELVFE